MSRESLIPLIWLKEGRCHLCLMKELVCPVNAKSSVIVNPDHLLQFFVSNSPLQAISPHLRCSCILPPMAATYCRHVLCSALVSSPAYLSRQRPSIPVLVTAYGNLWQTVSAKPPFYTPSLQDSLCLVPKSTSAMPSNPTIRHVSISVPISTP